MKPSASGGVSSNMRQSTIVALAGALLVAGTMAWHLSSRPAHAASAAAVPVLVELFTSEGCSSCPPADELLMDLNAHALVPGAQVITLSEHVDYWDSLGWRDPFSKAAFTDRQAAYTHTTGDSSYTPQMIVDGQTAFVGSDRSAALAAIGRAAAATKAPLTLTWATDPQPTLSMTLAPNAASAGAAILVAITEDGLRNAVTRGENAGHTIAHTSVVRRLSDVGQARKDGSFTLRLPVAVDSSWNPRHLHVIAFAQSAKTGAIASASAIAWPEPSR